MRRVDTSFVSAGGPFYDDLRVGDVLSGAPAITITEGLAAAHHAILGGRLHLAFDHPLARTVTGEDRPLASPGLVCDLSIGQSTLVTQRAIANLFYRGMILRSFPRIGDTLRTTTEVIGLRGLAAKPGRPPRGLVTMRIRTTADDGRTILDYARCAMLPGRAQPDAASQGETDPRDPDLAAAALSPAFASWNLGAFREHVGGPHFADIADGVTQLVGGDVVTSAPELARLTFNLASIHHDRTGADGRERLVYGGHTIGLAAAQLTRAFPALVTPVAWKSCDHLGPVREGDTLHSEIMVEGKDALASGGGLVHLRVQVKATSIGDRVSDVLDWRLIGLFA